jgi:predicted nuclease of predicted toxin-antitoxin system
MKILLDECIDRRLSKEFLEYEIKTVPQMKWAGIKDGELLALAAQEFDVFITVDRNLSFQQNIPQFDIAVIVLQAQSNRLADLKPIAPKILAILGKAIKGKATLVSA